MSIHVCKCTHNGKEEHHLRYPGLSEEEAQSIADGINGGALFRKPLSEKEISKYFFHPIPNLGTAIAFARAIEKAHDIK